jgi:alkylation response protein AidB-like acyl-CoA dehydrogenase
MATREEIRTEHLLRAGGSTAVLAAARETAALLSLRAAEHDRDGSFPFEGIDAIWRAGLGNLTLGGALGGVGSDLTTTAAAVSLLAGGDASAALVLVMHLAHAPLFADPESGLAARVRQAFVESALAGPALVNALRVEPELGSPARGGVPATRAERVRDTEGAAVWAISGRKIFSTGAPGLRWLLVWGATAADDPDGVRIGWFLVPGDAPGIVIEPTWDHLGMRGSASHDVVFTDVRIPSDHAFGLHAPSHGGSGRDASTSARMLVLLLAVYRGVAQAARDWLAGFLRERVPANLGAPLASLPRFQTAVGEIESRLAACARLIDGLAHDLDAGGVQAERAAAEAPLVKVSVTRGLIEAVELAVSLVGNAGLTHHHPLQRHLRDVLCSRVHTPQEDAVLLATGRTVLATPKQGAPDARRVRWHDQHEGRLGDPFRSGPAD